MCALRRELTLEVGRRRVRVTSPERPLFRDGTTKADVLSYYRSVAPALLPHIAERPMTLWRAPDGTWANGWFQTICRSHPSWLPTEEVRFDVGTTHRFCVLSEEAAVVWAVNLGTIEFHPLLAARPRLDEALVAVIDLDPGAGAGLAECARVALLVRDDLAGLTLRSFAKASGGAGIHVVVPLNAGATFMATRALVRGLADRLAREHPHLVVATSSRAHRAGRVYVDWAQNHRSRSTIAPYSLVGHERSPAVAMPVRWELIERAASGETGGLRVTPGDAIARVERDGDVFAEVLSLVQTLEKPDE